MEGWIPGEEELKKSLSVIFKHKPPPSVSKIDPICHVALAYVKYYKHVVHHIIKFARNCAPEYRLSLLYIIDAVCKATKNKKCGSLYSERFGKEAEIFINIILACPRKDWDAVFKILGLWADNKVLPNDALQKIDQACLKVTGRSIYSSSSSDNSRPINPSSSSSSHHYSTNNDPRIASRSSDPRHRSNSNQSKNNANNPISFDYSDDDSDDDAQMERLKRIGQEHKEQLKEQYAEHDSSLRSSYGGAYSVDPLLQYYESVRGSNNPYPSNTNLGTSDSNIQHLLANAPVNQLQSYLQPSHSADQIRPPINSYQSSYQNPPMNSLPPYQQQHYQSQYQQPPPQDYSHTQQYNQPPPIPQNDHYNQPPPQDRYNPPPTDNYQQPPPTHSNPPPPKRSEKIEYKKPIHVYSTTLYIGKLGRGISERSLRSAFSPFGEIRTLMCQGNKAFVQYVYRPDAEEAKRRMNNQIIEGREISIGWALNPRMTKESLNRQTGEGDMPPHTLTNEAVEDMRARGIIIHDPNQPDSQQDWNSPYSNQDNYQVGLKRSRESWGESAPDPRVQKSSRY